MKNNIKKTTLAVISGLAIGSAIISSGLIILETSAHLLDIMLGNNNNDINKN